MLQFPNLTAGQDPFDAQPPLPHEIRRKPSFAFPVQKSEEPPPASVAGTSGVGASVFLASAKRHSMASFGRPYAPQRRVSLSIVEQVADTLHENMMNEAIARKDTMNRRTARQPTKPSSVGDTQPSSSDLPSRAMTDSILLSTAVAPGGDTARARGDEVMHRAVAHQKRQQDERRAVVTNTMSKTEAAAARKLFLENQRRVQLSGTWMSVVALVVLHKRIVTAITRGRLIQKSRRLIVPSVFVGLRRSLRRARQRLSAELFERPTSQQLRNADKLIALYTDEHALWLIDHLTLRYYFEQETIIFAGIEEDEMFILIAGSCDVVVGSKHVFTLRPGMTFGTVGMLTGEPRSARIVTRTPVFTWVAKRKDFEAFARGGDPHQQFQAAMNAISEMRTKNIRSVYRSLLDPSNLAHRYACFGGGVSQDYIVQLLTRGLPRILRGGEVLLSPSDVGGGVEQASHRVAHAAPSAAATPTPPRRKFCGLILRGRVRLSMSVSAASNIASSLGPAREPAQSGGSRNKLAGADASSVLALQRLIAESMSSMMELPSRQMGGPKLVDSGPIPIGGGGSDELLPSSALASNHFFSVADEIVNRIVSLKKVSTVGDAPPAGYQQQRTFVDASLANSGGGGGATTFVVVAEFNGPMLFGLPSAVLHLDPLLAPPAAFFRVDVPAGCDAFVWEHQSLNEADMLEQLTVRQNCLNLRTAFLPQLSPQDLTQLFFSGSLAFDFLSKLHPIPEASSQHRVAAKEKSTAIPLVGTPWIIPAHHAVEFGSTNNWECIIVLRGSITVDDVVVSCDAATVGGDKTLSTRRPPCDAAAHHTPFVWPSTPFVFFGCTPFSATTGNAPVDALRVLRSDFIAWLLAGLGEGHLRTFVSAITEAFVSRTGRRPLWPGDGLHDRDKNSTASLGGKETGRYQRARLALGDCVSTSLARHSLTQLYGGVLVAPNEQRLNESSSPVAPDGAHPSHQVPRATKDLRGSPSKPLRQSSAMARVVREHEQRLAASLVAQANWKRSTAASHRQLHQSTAEVSASVPADVERNSPLTERIRLSKCMRGATNVENATTDRCSSSPSCPRKSNDDAAPLVDRVEHLIQQRWDDDHERLCTHGVPATYNHWRDTKFCSVPRQQEPIVSVVRREPHPPRLGLCLGRQAGRLAEELNDLPRPVALRSSSARSSRAQALDPQRRQELREQLFREVRSSR